MVHDGGSAMRMSLGRTVVAVAVAVAALGSAPQPASADTPTVSIPPDEVTDGVPVTLTTSGFPTGVHGFVECPTANIGAALPGDLPQGCALLHIGFEPVPPSFAVPVARELTWVGADFLPRVVDCAVAPGECSLGVFMPGIPDGSAYAPLTFASPIVPVPSRGLVDGATVEVSASGVPDGDWSVAQCATSYHGPTDGPSESACGPSVAVASSGGTVTGAIVVHDPLVSVDGTETPCGSTGCALVLRSTTGAWRSRVRVSFGPPTITVLNPSLEPVDWASFTLAGLPGTTAEVRQCAGPVGPDTCDAASVVMLDSIGGATGGSRPVAMQFTAESGVPVDCRVAPCSLVVVGAGGDVAASAPLPLRPPPTLTVTPYADLLDAQTVAVDAVGLDPSTGYSVRQCLPSGPTGEPWCTDALVVLESSPEGTLSTSVAVVARMPGPVARPVYCRAQCALGVWTPEGWLLAPFTMAEGSVTVTPTDGLADGQPVHVTGADLQPTYAGLPIGPWETGRAAIAQCAATTAAAPSLFTALDGCSTTGSRAVAITGSTIDGTVPVATTFTTFTGRAVDCAEPGACVVGLYRFEEDGSSTFAGSSVTFA